MFQHNPFMTAFLCLFKGAMAGIVSGFVYKWLKDKNETVATALAAISAPVVNTGLFCALVLMFFNDVLVYFTDALGFESTWKFLLLAILGTNFLFELILNAVLIPIVMRLVKVVKV